MNHLIRYGILDPIFGERNFRNEIVWFYGGGNSSKKSWGAKHDTLWVYAKSNAWVYNLEAVSRPNPEAARYKHQDVKGFYRWHCEHAHDYKIYLKPMNANDVWDDISTVKGNARENISYSTQKPEALLERIIKASSAG